MLATYFVYPTEPLTLEVEPALETLQYVYIHMYPEPCHGRTGSQLRVIYIVY